MSEFLDRVFHSPRLARVMRCGGSVLCMRNTEIGELWFTVRDDGWYGWFEAEHARPVEGAAINHVHELIHAVQRNGPMFRFEVKCQGVVRAVFQMPICIENRFEDDIPAAIQRLVEEWTILVPFITRVLNGEDVEPVTVEAKRSFDAHDEEKWKGIDPAAREKLRRRQSGISLTNASTAG